MATSATQHLLRAVFNEGAVDVMRIGIASDLHLEIEQSLLDSLEQTVGTNAAARRFALMEERQRTGHPALGPDMHHLAGQLDLFILAGDVDKGKAAIRYAAETARFLSCPVVFVPGNHEYYGLDMVSTLADMRAEAEASPGVTLLDRDRLALSIEGQQVVVLGCTLWTDYEVNGYAEGYDSDMERARSMLNDHRLINFGGRLFDPEDARKMHQMARVWLASEIPSAKATADKVFVVTHHAPSIKGVAQQFRHSSLSAAFVSDLTAEIKAWAPDLWVFGHTHHSTRFRIGHTRLFAAQRGYLWKEAGADTFTPRVIQL